MGTPRKINAILLNIKIKWSKLVSMCRYELTICWQNFTEIYLTWVKNIAKSFRGLLFLTHTVLSLPSPIFWPRCERTAPLSGVRGIVGELMTIMDVALTPSWQQEYSRWSEARGDTYERGRYHRQQLTVSAPRVGPGKVSKWVWQAELTFTSFFWISKIIIQFLISEKLF